MPKIILEKRTQYYLDYKLNNNKDSFEKLILTFIPIVENIIKKYKKSRVRAWWDVIIGVEEIINTINEFEIDVNVVKIGTYINQRINARLQFELKQENFISYEEYFKTKKNGEERYYEDYKLENIINSVSIKKVFNILNDHQKRIMILRYGLFNNSELTNEAIGKLLGISKQAVHIQEQEAIRKLQRKYISEKLKNWKFSVFFV